MKCNIIYNKDTITYMIDDKPQMIIPNNSELINFMGEILFLKDLELLKNKNISVLNIGLGAGYTTERILKYDNVVKLDVVEIFQEVINNLHNFDTYDSIVDDERCEIICGDAFDYVNGCDNKYDVVVMDVCQPDLEYSGRLFEKEFLSNVSKILNNDGIFLIWFYSKNSRFNEFKFILYYLNDVFMNVDYSEIENSIADDTYFFASNTYKVENNKSLIDKIK
ncbi:MAG: spermidine synthase [bacterium]